MRANLSPTTRRRRLRLLGIAAASGAVLIVAAGLAERRNAAVSRRQWTEAQAVPIVSLARITPAADTVPLVLPGTIQPIRQAAIYARVPGYLKNWNVDIGTHVDAGQVLATIDTPDLDRQAAQAQADLAAAQANFHLAELTARRWRSLVGSDAAAQQTIDEKQGDAAAKKAALASAQANFGRLQTLQVFRNVVAPFGGTVTARKIDIGALINGGSSAGQELFEVSDLRRVRLYIQVPQLFSADVKPGRKATFYLPQYPDRQFDARVTASTNAMDAASRSMTVELQADNTDGALSAGSYCQVHLQLPGHPGSMELPATALMPSDHGIEVALLGADRKVTLRTIKLGRDFGDHVEVVSGLAATDMVIDNPPETIQNGDTVQLASMMVGKN
ncbi:efflux RND transporter periplasmic adaptor subunit [Acetobacter sp.]|uniref:efflux RND transporter periplasmic adaptor subunit n=1 Tax=Acetobacter sp. TaxID=440 RepID=UPI0025C39DA4|nr:efflux RND transporter periplasmic adaptor subunit [Acetobacter sp.]MCH4092007.1 efflux RND transporter periplasmic adaptor subunit [Acetobacter sp.]MCI1300739.1 efflux RND transporter periplasmic adaptor subunit [Acetobacter sp.]MCI1317509.1 efflux RND transporter periplasmic adaptor subunit [Acetobacter sp.]